MSDTKAAFSTVSVKLRRHGFYALAGDLDRALSAILGIEAAIAATGTKTQPVAQSPTPVAGETPGEILRAARTAIGLSADALGAMVGIKGVSVRAHEVGQNSIRADVARKYAAALGIPAEALVFEKQGPEGESERVRLVKWLRDELAKPGRSQTDLAKRVGLHQTSVNRIVRGARAIKAHELAIIEQYLRETEKAPQDLN